MEEEVCSLGSEPSEPEGEGEFGEPSRQESWGGRRCGEVGVLGTSLWPGGESVK